MKEKFVKKNNKYYKKRTPEAEDVLIGLIIALLVAVAISQAFLWGC